MGGGGSPRESPRHENPPRLIEASRFWRYLLGKSPTGAKGGVSLIMPAARTTAPIARWLVKSEPDAFSWDQQVTNGVEPWTGVRNHLAKKNLMAMKKGDLAFFYHSNIGKEVVGVVEVAREAYPDPSAEEGSSWVCVDMRAVAPMPKPVGLAAIKAEPALAEVALIRQSRLSVMPIAPEHWDIIASMGGWAGK